MLASCDLPAQLPGTASIPSSGSSQLEGCMSVLPQSLLERHVTSSKGVIAENRVWAWTIGEMSQEQQTLLMRLQTFTLLGNLNFQRRFGRELAACVFLRCLSSWTGGWSVLTLKGSCSSVGLSDETQGWIMLFSCWRNCFSSVGKRSNSKTFIYTADGKRCSKDKCRVLWHWLGEGRGTDLGLGEQERHSGLQRVTYLWHESVDFSESVSSALTVGIYVGAGPLTRHVGCLEWAPALFPWCVPSTCWRALPPLCSQPCIYGTLYDNDLLGIISPMRIQVPLGGKCDSLSLIPSLVPSTVPGWSWVLSVMFVEWGVS